MDRIEETLVNMRFDWSYIPGRLIDFQRFQQKQSKLTKLQSIIYF